jgi:alkylation response protein AidB-like acyl-CoA dehydrogenase
MSWPQEYGGGGATYFEQMIFAEESTFATAPAGGQGADRVGPTLIIHGTEEQRAEHLPAIANAEVTWCQGYSEPGSGSDLASLQTRAIRDGDDFVINGQKIWTSGAQIAQWMILLTRTDPDAPKHKGISYFLLDMKTPGIEVRPLINMAGSPDFNEVFFDNVRIPKENLVGEENRGWYIGTATLDFERSGIATGVSHSLTVQELVKFQQEHGNGDAMMRYELADRAIESEVELMLNHQVIGVQARGMVPSNEATVAKLYSSELDQRIAGTGMRLMGQYAQLSGDSKYADSAMGGRFASTYMYATTSTIGGGTSEVQRNIIAQRGLGLPRN